MSEKATMQQTTQGRLDGHYFSFRTGGNPNDVVDRFEARQSGNRVTYYRNGPVGSISRVNSATANPMESYEIRGDTLHGPVQATIQSNADITYSHGYTSRKESESDPMQRQEETKSTSNRTPGSLDGHYFSFKTGGNPNDIVDRFEARESGNRVTYYRNGPVGSQSRVNSATAEAMESYEIRGDILLGPVQGTIQSNGDITYSHGYTSRKEDTSQPLNTASAEFEDGNWEVYNNIDMCGQGDVEIIGDWRSNTTIEELKQKVIDRGYTAVTVGSFGHAGLKKFDYQLTKDHCHPTSYECTIHIYKNSQGKKQTTGTSNPEMQNMLINGAWNGNLQEVRDAIQGGANIEAIGGPHTGTALNAACRNGHVEIVNLLISHDANINAANEGGWMHSCLHQAAFFSRFEVCQILVSNGADVNARVPGNSSFQAGVLPWEGVGRCEGSNRHEELVAFLKNPAEEAKTRGGAKSNDSAHFKDGPSLVLVARDSPRRCIFQHANDWVTRPGESLPLTLANSDYGVCCKTAHHESFAEWSYKKLVLGPKDQTMNVHFRNKVVFRTSDNDVMDVSHWDFKEENDLNMLHGQNEDQTSRHHDMSGRSFVVNSDRTISPASTPHLCLGVGQPRLVLVDKNSPNAIFFLNKPEGSFKLELAGNFQGFGITNLYEERRRYGEWNYTESAIGPANRALHAHFDEKFLRRESDGMALDVAFWKYEEGNFCNWVGGDSEDRTRQYGGGRDFIPDQLSAHGLPYMISCGGSPDFVLGSNVDPKMFARLSADIEVATSTYK